MLLVENKKTKFYKLADHVEVQSLLMIIHSARVIT